MLRWVFYTETIGTRHLLFQIFYDCVTEEPLHEPHNLGHPDSKVEGVSHAYCFYAL